MFHHLEKHKKRTENIQGSRMTNNKALSLFFNSQLPFLLHHFLTFSFSKPNKQNPLNLLFSLLLLFPSLKKSPNPFLLVLYGFYSLIWRGSHVIASKWRHGCNSKGLLHVGRALRSCSSCPSWLLTLLGNLLQTAAVVTGRELWWSCKLVVACWWEDSRGCWSMHCEL